MSADSVQHQPPQLTLKLSLVRLEVGDSPNKRLLFIGNYYDYEICCFKRKMSAPKRLIDSKAWCTLKAFYLKYYNHNGNTKLQHEKQHKIKALSEKENTEGARKT